MHLVPHFHVFPVATEALSQDSLSVMVSGESAGEIDPSALWGFED